MRKPVEGFSTKTTSKEHYQGIVQPVARGYTDYPSYAGDSLFPTSERNFKTVNNSVHHKMELPKKSNLLKSEIKGSLVIEGFFPYMKI